MFQTLACAAIAAFAALSTIRFAVTKAGGRQAEWP
jgi:hypothetical protein